MNTNECLYNIYKENCILLRHMNGLSVDNTYDILSRSEIITRVDRVMNDNTRIITHIINNNTVNTVNTENIENDGLSGTSGTSGTSGASGTNSNIFTPTNNRYARDNSRDGFNTFATNRISSRRQQRRNMLRDNDRIRSYINTTRDTTGDALRDSLRNNFRDSINTIPLPLIPRLRVPTPSDNLTQYFTNRLFDTYVRDQLFGNGNGNGNGNNININNDILATLFEPIALNPTPEQIESATRRIRFGDIESPINDTCPISHEAFTEDMMVRQIRNCSHIFTDENIMTWFQSNSRCPICRFNIQEHTNDNNNRNNSGEGVTSSSSSSGSGNGSLGGSRSRGNIVNPDYGDDDDGDDDDGDDDGHDDDGHDDDDGANNNANNNENNNVTSNINDSRNDVRNDGSIPNNNNYNREIAELLLRSITRENNMNYVNSNTITDIDPSNNIITSFYLRY